MKKIRLAVAGYGNLGKAVIANLPNFPDVEFKGIFSRRKIEAEFPVYDYSDAERFQNQIDVVVMCGGSKSDLPLQSPEMARSFNIVDSFDTHAKITEHVQNVGAAAKKAGTLAAVSVGWDPGLFSLNRLLLESVLPNGTGYTFWGRGVSQGHSDAVRRVAGVKKAVQYTVPDENALQNIRNGAPVSVSAKDRHVRECFIVAEAGADITRIEREVVTMPDYFADYRTVVHFITEAEFDKNHTELPHGGCMIRNGFTSPGTRQSAEFSIKLQSNPEFTAAVLLAYARAVYRLRSEGKTGCLTVFDIPYSYLSPEDSETLIQKFL